MSKAGESLDYATLLRRATEMVLANVVLAHAHHGLNNGEAAATHEAAVAELMADGVAEWATQYVQSLYNDSGVTAT
jgi:hypothetical protein